MKLPSHRPTASTTARRWAVERTIANPAKTIRLPTQVIERRQKLAPTARTLAPTLGREREVVAVAAWLELLLLEQIGASGIRDRNELTQREREAGREDRAEVDGQREAVEAYA